MKENGSCSMRRLGASRVPAWVVSEFAGADACAALCLVSREWDTSVASSPLWAARVRQAAPLTFHALCAARDSAAAPETVASTGEPGTDCDLDPAAPPFGLVFPPSRLPAREKDALNASEAAGDSQTPRLPLRTFEDLRAIFLDTDMGACFTPLHAAVSPGAAMELAAVAAEFSVAVDTAASADAKAAATALLDDSAAKVAAAVECGNWRAVAKALAPLRVASFGAARVANAKQRCANRNPAACFYPVAGGPKNPAVVAALTRRFPGHAAAIGVDSDSAALRFAVDTTPRSIGYLCPPAPAAPPRLGFSPRLFWRSPPEKRLLCVGPQATGKTTFLYESLGQRPPVRTIGFNVEEAGPSPRAQFRFTVWDIDGQHRIRPLWRHYFDNTDAVLFFVDCSDLFRVYEAREVFKKFVFYPSPSHLKLETAAVVLVCTKQDLPGAVLPEAVAAAFMSADVAEATAEGHPPTPRAAGEAAPAPGGPLLSKFGAWRAVGCNPLDRASCTAVLAAVEEDIGRLV